MQKWLAMDQQNQQFLDPSSFRCEWFWDILSHTHTNISTTLPTFFHWFLGEPPFSEGLRPDTKSVGSLNFTKLHPSSIPAPYSQRGVQNHIVETINQYIYVQFMYNLCTIYVQFMYNLYRICVTRSPKTSDIETTNHWRKTIYTTN